jgi:hypothetical protein
MKGENTASLNAGLGARQLDNVRREMEQSMASVDANASATAVSIVESARAVANSAAPLVFSTTQDELLDGANRALRTIEDLLSNVKGAAKTNPNVGTELSENAKNVAGALTHLLDAVKTRGPNAEAASSAASAQLTDSLEKLVLTVNKMPGKLLHKFCVLNFAKKGLKSNNFQVEKTSNLCLPSISKPPQTKNLPPLLNSSKTLLPHFQREDLPQQTPLQVLLVRPLPFVLKILSAK